MSANNEPRKNIAMSAFRFEKLDDGTCALIGYDKSLEDNDGRLCIPSVSPDGAVVTEVFANAFERREDIVSVTVPATVKVLGKKAFAFCPELREVVFEKGSCLTTIGNRTFCSCDKLTELTLPATLTECGEKAFAYCTRLGTIVIPAGLKDIANGMFEGCRTLNNVTFSARPHRIGTSAFAACVTLAELTLPSEYSEDSAELCIEDCAFTWCEHLASIDMGGGACRLSPHIFYLSAVPDIRHAA